MKDLVRWMRFNKKTLYSEIQISKNALHSIEEILEQYVLFASLLLSSTKLLWEIRSRFLTKHCASVQKKTRIKSKQFSRTCNKIGLICLETNTKQCGFFPKLPHSFAWDEEKTVLFCICFQIYWANFDTCSIKLITLGATEPVSWHNIFNRHDFDQILPTGAEICLILREMHNLSARYKII